MVEKVIVQGSLCVLFTLDLSNDFLIIFLFSSILVFRFLPFVILLHYILVLLGIIWLLLVFDRAPCLINYFAKPWLEVNLIGGDLT